MTKRRVLVSIVVVVGIVFAVALVPRRSEMWMRICIGEQDRDRVTDVRLTLSDSTRNTVVTTALDLFTEYGGKQLCANAAMYSDVAQRILAASKAGVTAALDSPQCRSKDFAVRRDDIKGHYELPRIQLGGHGTGYHVAAMHYRLSYNVDLDCR